MYLILLLPATKKPYAIKKYEANFLPLLNKDISNVKHCNKGKFVLGLL